MNHSLNNHLLKLEGLNYGLKVRYASPERRLLIRFHFEIIVLLKASRDHPKVADYALPDQFFCDGSLPQFLPVTFSLII
jgi:hypothetical protein